MISPLHIYLYLSCTVQCTHIVYTEFRVHIILLFSQLHRFPHRSSYMRIFSASQFDLFYFFPSLYFYLILDGPLRYFLLVPKYVFFHPISSNVFYIQYILSLHFGPFVSKCLQIPSNISKMSVNIFNCLQIPPNISKMSVNIFKCLPIFLNVFYVSNIPKAFITSV